MGPRTEPLTRGPSLWEDSLELVGVGGWTLDLQSGALHWTDQVYLIHELEPGTPMSVEEALGYYPPEARHRVEEAVAQGVSEGQGWDLELPLTTARGRKIWVRAVGRPKHEAGRLVRLFGAFQDITESRALRMELEQARQDAERCSQIKSEFLANMSHEIRTPLSAIVGFLELASTDCSPGDLEQYMATIRSNADHLRALLDDTLDLSKIEAGHLTLERVPFGVRSVIDEVVALHRPLAESQGLAFHLELDDNLPSVILGDPLRLRQVLGNLVSNAIKFTEAGSIKLRAYLVKASSELCFDLRDTGIGMSPAARDLLFQPFKQAEASTTRRFGGTGLGLCICQRIVTALGGRIEVESQAGRGSRFRVVLPCIWSDRLILQEPTDGDVVDQPSLVGRTVLLVDDGPDNQRLFRILLEREGLRVLSAENGEDALERLQELGATVELLLLDMHMPKLDGYATARCLREQGSQLPIIAMTANATAIDREQCMAAGCDEYLSKPVRPAELMAACRRGIELAKERTGTSTPTHG